MIEPLNFGALWLAKALEDAGRIRDGTGDHFAHQPVR
jgi:hypothetical protein